MTRTAILTMTPKMGMTDSCNTKGLHMQPFFHSASAVFSQICSAMRFCTKQRPVWLYPFSQSCAAVRRPSSGLSAVLFTASKAQQQMFPRGFRGRLGSLLRKIAQRSVPLGKRRRFIRYFLHPARQLRTFPTLQIPQIRQISAMCYNRQHFQQRKFKIFFQFQKTTTRFAFQRLFQVNHSTVYLRMSIKNIQMIM